MTFEIKGNQFYKDGEEIKIISGAVHYFRNLPDTWGDIFKKMKAENTFNMQAFLQHCHFVIPHISHPSSCKIRGPETSPRPQFLIL